MCIRDSAWTLALRRAQEGQGAQARELSFRLAELQRTRLGAPREALQLYQELLAEDPAHPGARAALEEWVRTGEEMSAAALEVLDPVLAQVGDHARRVALREVRMEGSPRSERVLLAAELRRIQELDMRQAPLAFMSAVKAFAEGLDREGLRPELERLAQETGSHEVLAEIYESTAADLPAGEPEPLALLRRAAELRESLGQPEEATRAWKALLAQAPKDRQALEALSRLYQRSSNAKSLSEVYAAQAQLAADPAERQALLF